MSSSSSGVLTSQSSSSSGFRGMSVPETIQFNTEETRDSVGGIQPRPSQYRPMQVPDRITLDEASSSSSPAIDETRPIPELSTRPVSDAKSKDVTSTQTSEHRFLPPQNDFNQSFSDNNDMAQRLGALEDRVRVLETKVQRIRNQAGSMVGDMGPSRFWYVVSFSAWMMLPLTVVFMFYYRRNPS